MHISKDSQTVAGSNGVIDLWSNNVENGTLPDNKGPSMNYNAFLRRIAIGLATLVFAAVSARGQSAFYVNAGATGSGSGLDWNNAYTAVPSTLVRGATYYVGTGSYGAYTFANTDTSTTYVTVLKATVANHGTSAGWQDSFANQAVFSRLITLNGYFIFDGATGGGPGSWTNNFGFKIQIASGQSYPAIRTADASGWEEPSGNYYCPYVTVRHIEVSGLGVNSPPQGNTYGCVLSNDYNTISHAWIHDTEMNPLTPAGNYDVVEFVYVGEYWPQYISSQGQVEHAEVMWAKTGNNPNSTVQNLTIRNCVFTEVKSTGGLIFTALGVNIYGNVFVQMPNNPDPWFYCGNGIIGTQTGWDASAINIFNNTFINCNDYACNGPLFGFYLGAFGSQNIFMTNNLFYGSIDNISSVGSIQAQDYDYYVSLPAQTSNPLVSEPHGGTNNVGNPFNNYQGLDFTLAANTPPGANLGAPFNIDPNGNVRTSWSRGAYEYTGGAANTNPIISVSPGSLSFGPVAANSSATNSFTVQNVGGGTLAGTATVPQPFSVVSGSAYSLGPSQSQTVLVSFTPSTNASANSQTVTFTGGGGASATVNGQLFVALPGLSFPVYSAILSSPFVISAGGYIYQPATTDVTTGGIALYPFTITNGGQYVVRADTFAPSISANSFYVNIDAMPTDPTMIWDVPVSMGFTNQVAAWRGSGTETNDQFAPEVFNLSVGLHNLYIVGREGNTELGTVTISPYIAPPPNLRVVTNP